MTPFYDLGTLCPATGWAECALYPQQFFSKRRCARQPALDLVMFGHISEHNSAQRPVEQDCAGGWPAQWKLKRKRLELSKIMLAYDVFEHATKGMQNMI
jgi:hypothetical protein